jgi:hypothetical protein
MELHQARRAYGGLGNYIPVGDFVWQLVDLDKITRNNKKIEISKIENDRRKEK